MSLKDQIKNDIKEAMRAKDIMKRDTLRNINTAIKQIEVDQRVTLDDAAVESIMMKYVKQREDAIVQFREAGRDDLVSKDEAERQLIMSYLPEPVSDEELEAIVQEIVNTTGASSMKDMGKVMGMAKSQLGSRADGGRINQAAKKLLS